ncbi:MAG: amidohydrolase [Balneolaceae bacterium]|nr:amidohydrolase [Balneolaceae bacterium]
MKDLDDQTLKQLIEFRRELHRTAEVSGAEEETARRVRAFLEDQQPDGLMQHIGGNGLAATWTGDREGPSVMIRAELDALPIPETNAFEYRSKTEGVSHKCGHDGHMAILGGVAYGLNRTGPKKGSVCLLFQPAEETGEGARRVLADEKFKRMAPDYIFALHNLPGYPENQVVTREGIFSSASRGLEIYLKGSTSHAAHPERGISPAPALAQLIQSLAAFPQHHTSIEESAKVTVIHAALGAIAFGTSPGQAECRATLRSHDRKVMQRLCEKAEHLATETARAHRLEVDLNWVEIFEPTVNDAQCNTFVRRAAETNGFDTTARETPFAWSEDFGRFTSKFKGAMFGLGAGADCPQLHAGDYDFPDRLIPAGTAMFMEIIDQILGLER